MRWLSGWRGCLALWAAFLALHAWLALLLWAGPLQPFNDVTVIYRDWVAAGLRANEWVGLQLPFVYPPLALAPMVAAAAFGVSASAFGWTWLALVALLDAVAVLVLSAAGGPGARRRGTLAAWWWLAFLLALGPVALGRLEAVTAPLAIIAVRLLVGRPAVAGALLAAAAWMKIWPAAILAAAIVALRRRAAVLAAALLASLVVIGVDLVLGGGRQLLSFLDDQQGRGLQVESLLAGPWLLAAALGAPGVRVVWNAGINTFEIAGPGTEVAGALSTPLLLAISVLLLGLGVLAVVRRRPPLDVLVPLALAMVAAFVVTNKVGSPQFAAWLAAPVVLALLAARRASSRRAATRLAVAGLVLALLTQCVYPFWYDAVLSAWMPVVVVLELRNLLWLLLLGWGALQLARRARRADEDAVLDRLHP